MQTFLIQATSKTPSIKLDPKKGLLEIKGTAIPEDAIQYYAPLMDFINEYLQAPQSITTVNIQFDFCNTESAKCILAMFKKLEEIVKLDKVVNVNWFYKDNDMLTTGHNYRMIINLPFEMHPASN